MDFINNELFEYKDGILDNTTMKGDAMKNTGLLKKNRNYRFMLSAALINRFGDSIDVIAMSWLVYEVSQSALMSGMNYAVNYIPTIFLQPLCGAYVSKHNHKKIMVFTDFARAFLVGLAVVLRLCGYINAPILLCITFLISCMEAFRLPCNVKVTMQVVDKEDYASAQSMTHSLSNVVQLVGVGCAGTIIAIGGSSLGMAIDAVSFVLSGTLLAMMRLPKWERSSAVQDNTVQVLKEGFRYLLANEKIALIVLIAFMINALVIPASALASAYCSQVFQRGAQALSVLNTSLSLGSVLGASLYSKFGSRVPLKKMMLGCYGSIALIYMAYLLGGLVHESDVLFYLVISAVPFVSGIMLSSANVCISILEMNTVDEAYISRVDAIINACCTAGMPIASAAASVLSIFLPLQGVYLVFASAVIVVSIVMAVTHSLQKLES